MTQVSVRRLVLSVVGSMLALALSGFAVRAADTAKIEGYLKEASGAVLADAHVTLRPPSGADKRATTDAKGGFSFSGLGAGTYRVTIESPGFQTTRYTNVILKDGQTRQFDFSLRPGAVSEAVEVDITRPMGQAEVDRLFNPGTTSPAPGTGTTRGGIIAGRLLNGAGAPAQAVRVGVVPADPAIYGSPRTMAYDARTDSLGFYRIELPPGRYFVVAGSETFTQDGSYMDRPVYFPGVPDASRAMAINVTLNSYDTADFRLDSPVVVLPPSPPIVYYYGPYRVSGQVVFTPQIIVPQPYPYSVYPDIYYPYPGPTPAGLQVILQSGNSVQRGCGPARTTYSTSVGWDGQFDFRSVSSGVYDVCVIQAGVVALRGGSSGAAPRTILYGPATVVVDRDIAGLRLDIGPVAIYR